MLRFVSQGKLYKNSYKMCESFEIVEHRLKIWYWLRRFNPYLLWNWWHYLLLKFSGGSKWWTLEHRSSLPNNTNDTTEKGQEQVLKVIRSYPIFAIERITTDICIIGINEYRWISMLRIKVPTSIQLKNIQWRELLLVAILTMGEKAAVWIEPSSADFIRLASNFQTLSDLKVFPSISNYPLLIQT